MISSTICFDQSCGERSSLFAWQSVRFGSTISELAIIFSFLFLPLWSETDLIHVRMNLNIPAELCWKYSGGKHKLETENKHHAPLFPGPGLNTSQQPINLIKSRKMFQRNYIFTRSSSALRMPALHSSKSWYKCFFFLLWLSVCSTVNNWLTLDWLCCCVFTVSSSLLFHCM